MTYSTEPKYRKYVKRSGFWSFAKKKKKKDGDTSHKKLMDTAPKTGKDRAKSTSKRVV